jgi:phosphomannomutase
MVEILEALGARVERLGWSDTFIAVDTEAIRAEDIEAARHWSAAFRLDAIVSTDGDSDRPLVADEKGKWLRGDVAGVLASTYLGADGIATPVSCNSLIERCGRFARVVRTRIGSPFVIEAMAELADMGYRCVVGFEANGGLLLGSDIERQGRTLRALPTRDAIIVHLAAMLNAFSRDASISDTVMELPARYTHSIRLQSFPVAKSQAKIDELSSGDDLRDRAAIDALLADYLGPASVLDRTDGLRITLASGEVVHFRPSGNAPELRCYTEADSEARAVDIAAICRRIMESWR